VPDASDLGPSHPTECAVCGVALGGGPWWMLEIGRAAHEACAPWEQRPFPLRDRLVRLRALRRRLVRAADAVGATIAWLERADLVWPSHAHAILCRAREWERRLERRLAELGVSKR
jgi:hypothetical protein